MTPDSRPSSRYLLSAVCSLGFYLILAIGLTWPLAIQLDTAVADRGDPLLNAFIIDWSCHALTYAPLQLFDAPIFHPAKFPLAFSEHMTGVALLVLPFHLAGLSAVTVYNIAILLSFALAGYGAFVLARVVTGDTLASLIAGVFFAFVSFKFDHLSHVQIIASGWIPLTLAALLMYARTRATRHVVFFAIAFTMNGLTNIYWLMFTSVAVLVTILFLRIVDRRVMIALVISGLVLLPFLIPYQVVSKTYRMSRTSGESLGGSATISDWFTASPASWIYGWREGHPERHLFPGLLAIALFGFAAWPRTIRAAAWPPHSMWLWLAIAAAGAGCVLVRWHKSDVAFMLAVVFLIAAVPWREHVVNPERWVASIWIVIGFIGSFGERSFLHSFLFRVIEPFRATRTPARWAIIAYCGLAIWMAIGASRLPRLRFALLALSIVEVIPRFTWQHVPAQFPPVYAWLARTRPACAIELPIGWNETEAGYVLASTTHHVPIMNGVSGFDPPLHEALSKHAYDDAMLDLIAQNGGTVVIVHPEAAERVRGWRLKELARFPDGDVAYAIGARASRPQPAGVSPGGNR
ncbi:MAG TPA: hypothetical protein VJ901_13920 [Thermoanaerobaculia bacterium]|nr:hypothetical protein [Thermoanaerobaculia bacterium]